MGQQVKVEKPYVIIDIDKPKVKNPIDSIIKVCEGDYLLNALYKCIKANDGFIISTPSGGIHMVVYGGKCLEHIYKNREQLTHTFTELTRAEAVEFLSKGNLIHLPFHEKVYYHK